MIDVNIGKFVLKKFTKLVKENPDLRVVYMVDSDIAQDFNGYWLGRNTSVNVDSILNDDLHERVWIRSIDDDYDIYESFFGGQYCTDEYVEEEVDKLPWEKVIVVWIGP